MDPPCDVRALYEYKSEHEDDLNFESGQIIHVFAVEDEEWLRGSYTSPRGVKESGMFPKSFVELVEAVKHAPAAPSRPTASSSSHAGPSAASTSIVEQHSNDGQEEGTLVTNSSIQDVVPEPAVKHLTSQQRSSTDHEAKPEKSEVVREVLETSTPVVMVASEESSSVVTESPKATPQISETSERAPTATTATEETTRTIPRTTAPVKTLPVTETASQATSPQTAKSPPADKPIKSNAFRDRIAAFNKQETAPIAPKPMVKPKLANKPFVAPPPSKDAFVHIPGIAKPKPALNQGAPAKEPPAPTPINVNDRESSKSIDEPPKVGSLKDRIAALQAERNQLAARKEGPPKSVNAVESDDGNVLQTSTLQIDNQILDATESGEPRSETITRHPPTMPIVPQDETMRAEDESLISSSPSSLSRQNTNRSIESIRPQATGLSVLSSKSDIALQNPVPIPSVPFIPVAIETTTATSEDFSATTSTNQPNTDASATIPSHDTATTEADVEERQPSSEDEMDEEERRKQQLRERMAKMSGGMGMGMHMALGLGGGSRSSKPKAAAKPTPAPETAPEIHQAPIPMPGLPPMPVRQNSYTEVRKPSEAEDDPVDESVSTGVPVPSESPEDRRPATAEARMDHDESSSRMASAPAVPPLPGVAMAPRSPNESLPGLESDVNRMTLESRRDGPPPIPSGRPSMSFDRPAPPPVPPSRPSMDLDNVTSTFSDSRSPEQQNAPPPVPVLRPITTTVNDHSANPSFTNHDNRTSIDTVRSPPPPVPTTDSPRGPPQIPSAAPPVPVAAQSVRAQLVSPPFNSPPAMSPGGSKRMS